MTLENMLGKGLEKAATDREEIARYLTKIQRRIEDCGKNNISLDSRFDIGFEEIGRAHV